MRVSTLSPRWRCTRNSTAPGCSPVSGAWGSAGWAGWAVSATATGCKGDAGFKRRDSINEAEARGIGGGTTQSTQSTQSTHAATAIIRAGASAAVRAARRYSVSAHARQTRGRAARRT
ncbi:hypothetical protein PT2222_280021 [Paraburkholderia tropica]